MAGIACLLRQPCNAYLSTGYQPDARITRPDSAAGGSSQARVLEGVLAGLYDIGIAEHRPNNPRLDGDFIGSDVLCLLMPAAEAGSPSYADLGRLGFIADSNGFAYADELLSANFPHDYQGVDRLRVRSFINQIGQIPEPVARGVGYTILPRSGVEAYPDHKALRCLKLASRVLHALWMVRRRGRVLAARTKRIVAEVIDAIKELAPRA